MNSEYNTENLYKKIEETAKYKPEKFAAKSINYIKKIPDYDKLTREYREKSGPAAAKNIAIQSMKSKVHSAYRLSRRTIKELIKKP
jgi:hypothetical protein